MLDTQLYDGGGVMQTVNIGILNLVDVGFSYGGSHIVSSSKITWQPHVGANIRIRIVEESFTTPAFSLGFDSQGDGPYYKGEEKNRFRIKSRGAYIAVSRNYLLLGDLGLHGGINYSLENDDGDFDPSFWVGMNKTLGKNLELCGEYDFATNDNLQKSTTLEDGYLNAAVKWNFGNAFTLEFDLKNILRTEKEFLTAPDGESPEPSRELRFFYRGSF
jgi:hypothetical protein